MWRRNDFIYSIFGRGELKQLRKSIQIIQEFAEKIITERRNHLMQNQFQPQNHSIYNSCRNMTFLDIILQATLNGKPLTNDEIKEEVHTFMFAVIIINASSLRLLNKIKKLIIYWKRVMELQLLEYH